MASACETRDACRADANLARRARDVRARGGRRRHRLLRRRARRAGAQARVRGAGLAPLLHHMRLGGVACERAREDAEAVRGHILLPSNDNACGSPAKHGKCTVFSTSVCVSENPDRRFVVIMILPRSDYPFSLTTSHHGWLGRGSRAAARPRRAFAARRRVGATERARLARRRPRVRRPRRVRPPDARDAAPRPHGRRGRALHAVVLRLDLHARARAARDGAPLGALGLRRRVADRRRLQGGSAHLASQPWAVGLWVRFMVLSIPAGMGPTSPPDSEACIPGFLERSPARVHTRTHAHTHTRTPTRATS